VSLDAQPAAADASRKRLTRRLRLVPQHVQRADQRLLPGTAARVKDVLAEHGQENGAGGWGPDGPTTQLIVHRSAAYPEDQP
jgi:hypothetical protein